jgi:hypothetical protein
VADLEPRVDALERVLMSEIPERFRAAWPEIFTNLPALKLVSTDPLTTLELRVDQLSNGLELRLLVNGVYVAWTRRVLFREEGKL